LLTDLSDGTPSIVVATSIYFTAAGQINGVRWYCTATTGGTWTGCVWRITQNDAGSAGTGTLLASKAYPGTPTGGAWNTVTLDTPVTIIPNTAIYRIGMHNSQGRYVAYTNFPAFATTGAGITNGNIVASWDADNPVGIGGIANGNYAIGATSTDIPYPAVSFNHSCYFVDVDFAGDSTAPSVPTGLQTTAVGSNSASLSWTASTDNVGVTGYELQVIGV
jgi:hypothetical protein